MSIQPTAHDQLQKEFRDLLAPLKAEKLAGQCADIVVRERMKILTLKSLTDDQLGTVALERVRSFSDRSNGEWISPNPHDPAQKRID